MAKNSLIRLGLFSGCTMLLHGVHAIDYAGDLAEHFDLLLAAFLKTFAFHPLVVVLLASIELLHLQNHVFALPPSYSVPPYKPKSLIVAVQLVVFSYKEHWQYSWLFCLFRLYISSSSLSSISFSKSSPSLATKVQNDADLPQQGSHSIQ